MSLWAKHPDAPNTMGRRCYHGLDVRRNGLLEVAVGVDLSVGLAVGSDDAVAAIVVAGVGVGSDVAVVGSTSRSVPESESDPDSVARLPKDADKHRAYNQALMYY